jgi:signal transduction histidine kinase
MNAPDIPLPPKAANPGSDPVQGALTPSRLVPAVIAMVLALFLVLLDFTTWIELNIAVAYSLPLVFAAGSRRPRLLWTLAIILIVVTFVVYQAQIPFVRTLPVDSRSGLLSMGDPYLVDRSLAAVTVLLTATILQGWMFSLRAVEIRDVAIEENNERLAQANQELVRQREEITRQNLELERRRREVEAISSRKTQMLASISHDIRTPIHTISMMAEAIRRTAGAPAPEARLTAFAQRLQSHALSVAELLSEVIDVASFDAGQVSLHASEFTLDELLAEQGQRLAPLAEGKGLQLNVQPAAAPLLLRTDKVKLGRIMANLVSNAVKFTAQGTITLASSLDAQGRVCVHIADTGCGIKAENLERIFGEFCQEDGAAVQSGSGWGLGLAICRRLTKLLGGELLVESQLGTGSTFTVALPSTVRVQEGGRLVGSSERPARGSR